MPTDLAQVQRQILQSVMEELGALREQALALSDQSQIDSVIETIDFWKTILKRCRGIPQLIAWSCKARGDITYELTVEKYGWDSPETDAVFEEEKRNLSELM